MALNDKKIIAALSMIDDDLIEEAASASKKAPKRIWIRYAAAAACICIAAMFALRAGPFTAKDSAAGGSTASGGVTSGTSAESSQNGFTGGSAGATSGSTGGSMYPSSDQSQPDGGASEDFTARYTELTGEQKELALKFCLVSDDGLTSSSPVYDILTGSGIDGDVKDTPNSFADKYPPLDTFASALSENGRYVYTSIYTSDSVGIVEGMSNKGYFVSVAASSDLYVLGGDAAAFIGHMRTMSDRIVFAETPAGNVLLFYHTVFDGIEYILTYTDTYENFLSGSGEFELLVRELSDIIYRAD